mmetsp:Transcript_38515/g.46532  ORF Transcript_38515/g.46532 Transcript_38515/m.46532 type:complete len:154 (+) Transcript_38515:293-754(+)|eukprot:CAMPEP_0197849126 /NCGR_PEP_ID=MMETSP1438-20131217/10994_1 /TAXON_ID=1461541 /ORGANISM="Pterosperma sp., Strain CCMP1384" /LENGTH=153 /DNA_ID=CAMNT_0043461661 /DNA_START=282 /DNA_END=743 /DNA_ORIENTATION=+
MIELYHENEDVYFGDVNLQSPDATRGGPTANPGQGGWPTIRYYNKQTGIDGASWEKKTSMPPCEELGPKGQYLQEYIDTAASTSLCAFAYPYKGCSEKEQEYIKKWTEKSAEDVASQYERLHKMSGDSKMEPSLMQWIKQRISILKKHPKFEL